jgi:hypothetical protein
METSPLSGLPPIWTTAEGRFEAHVTVDAASRDALARFERVCAQLQVKCLHVALPRGAMRFQPMTTTIYPGTLAGAWRQAQALAQQLAALGFPVLRVKIEAAPDHPGIPQTDAEACALGGGVYHEHHLKLRLPEALDLSPLAALVEVHGGHLSQNARKPPVDGLSERFVTVRAYRVGQATSKAALARLAAALQAAGHPVVKSVSEFCVLDTRAGLDAGWLQS